MTKQQQQINNWNSVILLSSYNNDIAIIPLVTEKYRNAIRAKPLHHFLGRRNDDFQFGYASLMSPQIAQQESEIMGIILFGYMLV